MVTYPPANAGVAGDSGNQVQSLGWEDPSEECIETHSSTLVWEIPWLYRGAWGLRSMDLWLTLLKHDILVLIS